MKYSDKRTYSREQGRGSLVLLLIIALFTAVSVAAEDNVKYIDADGSVKICPTAINFNPAVKDWGSGWYYAHGSVKDTDGRVFLSGNVHLILADSCDFVIYGGIGVYEGSSLTIYAQSKGANTGKLKIYPSNDYINGTDTITYHYSGLGGGGSVTINGGNIAARGDIFGAGIGGGLFSNGGNITINDGTVEAVAGNNAAAIGGGVNGNGGNIIIRGGTVTATGRYNGAGIGGGFGDAGGGSGGNIIITGGKVTATGGTFSAGIGGGNYGKSGSIVIINDNVSAKRGNGIGSQMDIGHGNNYEETSLSRLLLTKDSNNLTGNCILPCDLTIPAGKTLTVSEEDTLTIPKGLTLNIATGAVLINEGLIRNDGDLVIIEGGAFSGFEPEGEGEVQFGSLFTTDYAFRTHFLNAGIYITKLDTVGFAADAATFAKGEAFDIVGWNKLGDSVFVSPREGLAAGIYTDTLKITKGIGHIHIALQFKVSNKAQLITLQIPSWIESLPTAGSSLIDYGENFAFNLSLAGDSIPVVKTSQPYETTITRRADGSFHIVVSNIKTNVVISVSTEYAAATGKVETIDLRTGDNTLYINTASPETLRIYNLSGALVKTLRVAAGETSVALPPGIYIINVRERNEKIIVK
ncbi:MAG: T9SS type A sorting domain-containing protein [Tannerella sp.]|jgi:hypothetical protein|nr:T9SS type A sorting domain-containing protein [Tannerella sp.]